jgi:hypothetical protein
LDVDAFDRRHALLVDRLGVTVYCELDTAPYPSGSVVFDAETAGLNQTRAQFHGEWNDTISPQQPPRAPVS